MTSTVRKVTAGTAAAVGFGIFVALGTWQLERRVWKLDLIDRVERRVHAPPVAAPPRSAWASVTATGDEYRHVRATGTFLPSLQTPVQALTELGSGYWLLTPLRLADGSIILVNRGFVSPEALKQAQASATETPVTVTGLLRLSEPGGAFLRHNDPRANRWYSRDVEGIAAARGLSTVAPYFIDADAAPVDAADAPVGGLTVIAFHNNHLLYAITWYTLALMIPTGLWLALRTTQVATSP